MTPFAVGSGQTGCLYNGFTKEHTNATFDNGKGIFTIDQAESSSSQEADRVTPFAIVARQVLSTIRSTPMKPLIKANEFSLLTRLKAPAHRR